MDTDTNFTSRRERIRNRRKLRKLAKDSNIHDNVAVNPSPLYGTDDHLDSSFKSSPTSMEFIGKTTRRIRFEPVEFRAKQNR